VIETAIEDAKMMQEGDAEEYNIEESMCSSSDKNFLGFDQKLRKPSMSMDGRQNNLGRRKISNSSDKDSNVSEKMNQPKSRLDRAMTTSKKKWKLNQ
jgi:hypothetical protein